MRVLIGLCCFGSMLGVTILAYPAAGERAQPKRKLGPTSGVKTPGVQISFEGLKPEAEIQAPGQPTWTFFAEAAFFPQDNGLGKIDAKTGKPGDPITGIAKACAGMASGFKSLWVPSCADGTVFRIDAKSRLPTAKVASGVASVLHGIAASPDSIWILTDSKTTLSRIDPDQNAVVGELRVPAGCHDLTFGETALWLVCPAENKVYRIDPATNLVANQVDVSEQPEALAVGEGSVWVLCGKQGKVERIDPKTNKVTKTIDLGSPGATGSLAVGEGSVWVTMSGFPLTRISPLVDKERVVQQFYGKGGGAITTSKDAVWLVNTAEGTVWKIDPKRVAATLAE